jgi:hypothetical protein
LNWDITQREKEGKMKVITIADLPGIVPPDHFDLLSYRIVDATIGAKAMGASLGRMEP